jgi:hypothetical protein
LAYRPFSAPPRHDSTITGILQRLVARGVIERARDPADSRRALRSVHAQRVGHRGEVGEAGARRRRTVEGPRGRRVLAEIASRLDAR